MAKIIIAASTYPDAQAIASQLAGYGHEVTPVSAAIKDDADFIIEQAGSADCIVIATDHNAGGMANMAEYVAARLEGKVPVIMLSSKDSAAAIDAHSHVTDAILKGSKDIEQLNAAIEKALQTRKA